MLTILRETAIKRSHKVFDIKYLCYALKERRQKDVLTITIIGHSRVLSEHASNIVSNQTQKKKIAHSVCKVTMNDEREACKYKARFCSNLYQP